MITESTRGGDKSELCSLFGSKTKPGVEHWENAPESQSETDGDEARQFGWGKMLGGAGRVMFLL